MNSHNEEYDVERRNAEEVDVVGYRSIMYHEKKKRGYKGLNGNLERVLEELVQNRNYEVKRGLVCCMKLFRAHGLRLERTRMLLDLR